MKQMFVDNGAIRESQDNRAGSVPEAGSPSVFPFEGNVVVDGAFLDTLTWKDVAPRWWAARWRAVIAMWALLAAYGLFLMPLSTWPYPPIVCAVSLLACLLVAFALYPRSKRRAVRLFRERFFEGCPSGSKTFSVIVSEDAVELEADGGAAATSVPLSSVAKVRVSSVPDREPACVACCMTRAGSLFFVPLDGAGPDARKEIVGKLSRTARL